MSLDYSHLLTLTARPEILIPSRQVPWPQVGFAVRTGEKPFSMLKSIAAAVHAVDLGIALAQPETMDQIRDEAMSGERFSLVIFSSFAAVALLLLLAALGIYGVMAFSVAQRSHEIALRMALGATRPRVIALVLPEGLPLAGIGLVLGLVGAYYVGRAMLSKQIQDMDRRAHIQERLRQVQHDHRKGGQIDAANILLRFAMCGQ